MTDESKADVEMAAEPKEAEKPKEAEAAKPKVPEKPKEVEVDAPADGRPKVSGGSVAVSTTDSTLNVFPAAGGRLLMSLSEGGFQNLLGSARCTAGVKAGRYMFEAKVVQTLTPEPGQGASGQQRSLVRIGLSLAGSPLILGDGEDNICFDSDGFFQHGTKRSKASQRFGIPGKEDMVGFLINLDETSENKKTVSLFINGVRASPPQPIPESLQGKALYPTFTFKNVSLQVNLGPTTLKPLPFTCHMLADAAKDDVEIAKSKAPKDGKYQVVYPVGLPDEGVFDWADDFLKKNPSYTELSDRSVLSWLQKSGAAQAQFKRMSNDRTEAKTGIQGIDDGSLRNTILALAPTLDRNYLVLELKSNLLEAERKSSLQHFGDKFKKQAMVMVGEPSSDYKKSIQAMMIAEKTAVIEAERKKKKAEETRKRAAEAAKKKAEALKQERLKAAKKAAAARAAKLAGKEPEPEEPEDEKMEEPEEEAKEPEEPMPVVELSEEEKALSYRKHAVPDLTPATFRKFYSKFSLPTKEEGFTEIKYAWQSADKSASYMKEWLLKLKQTQRAEDINPGDWFKEEWTKVSKALTTMKAKQNQWKNPAQRKALLAKRKAARAEKAKEEGTEVKDEEEPVIDADDLDVFTVENVDDLGNGEPLYANFQFEDWTLMTTRLELSILVHAFKKDVDDADRPGFTEEHLSFYYMKYFKKNFQAKNYGVQKFEEVMAMIKDTIGVSKTGGFIETVLAADTPVDKFVKLAEEDRRCRARRSDAGDETAMLKFPQGGQNAPMVHNGGQKRPMPASGFSGLQPIKKQAFGGIRR
eukprot:gnl/TRDRNA2_/TRDRNA2_84821_c0_seq1.p1 gnl/TRDRNA2_/TRDRNA2_84821_c0~~gnl/TRDRNA2_/TRDRNA2_84821_c0_seq1.p1  ORF type:complete len:810 (-),score=228.23 gnl/TRDRNA2_/TRDRNA2_84821_c0_seq1:96-2525(-)